MCVAPDALPPSAGHPVRHSSGVRAAAHLLHPPISGEAPQPRQHRAPGGAPHRHSAGTLRSVLSCISWLVVGWQKAEPVGAGVNLQAHFDLLLLNMFIFLDNSDLTRFSVGNLNKIGSFEPIFT